jgi:hypothetical protein
MRLVKNIILLVMKPDAPETILAAAQIAGEPYFNAFVTITARKHPIAFENVRAAIAKLAEITHVDIYTTPTPLKIGAISTIFAIIGVEKKIAIF